MTLFNISPRSHTHTETEHPRAPASAQAQAKMTSTDSVSLSPTRRKGAAPPPGTRCGASRECCKDGNGLVGFGEQDREHDRIFRDGTAIHAANRNWDHAMQPELVRNANKDAADEWRRCGVGTPVQRRTISVRARRSAASSCRFGEGDARDDDSSTSPVSTSCWLTSVIEITAMAALASVGPKDPGVTPPDDVMK